MSKHFNPGDVVEVTYPFAEGEDTKGVIQAKPRPALILTVPDSGGNFIAAVITGSGHHSNTVSIAAGDNHNVKFSKPSHVRADKLYTFHEQSVIQHRGSLKPAFLKKVLAITCPAVGCSCK